LVAAPAARQPGSGTVAPAAPAATGQCLEKSFQETVADK
jgi:hypothetical protein